MDIEKNEWTQVEDGADWANCPNKKFDDWTEKVVCYFWEEPEDQSTYTACPVIQTYYDSNEYPRHVNQCQDATPPER